MTKLAIFLELKAKSGKKSEVEAFLKKETALASNETHSVGSRISIGSCLHRWSRTSAAQVL